MNCPKCQTQNPQGARFCVQCGTALAPSCPHCGANLQAGARFCHNCGQPVSAASPPQAPAIQPAGKTGEMGDSLQRYIPKELLARLEAARRSHLMVGERRVVTILFCDVKGSSLAASKMDPEEWAEIINGAFEHMIEPVYRYEGTVARLQGDGLLAFFGAPIAHEDDPQRAVLAGMHIVQAIRGYGERVKKGWGIDFDVRVGINTGLVVVGAVGSDLRLEYSALGDAINMAARMEQTAQPGTVQIAEPTYKLVAPLFDFEAIEGLEVKGRETAITAYRFRGQKAAPGRLRGIPGINAPLIGRERQMEALWAAAARLREGQGQIISVIGEAGLGKSRLIAEFHKALNASHADSPEWLEGRSLSYEANKPFAPFLPMFQRFYGLLSPGSDEAQPETEPGPQAVEQDGTNYTRIWERLESLFPGQGDEIAPFFSAMLGLPVRGEAAERVRYLEPPHLRGLIFAHIASLLERLSKDRPLVLYLDDLHWVDPTSLELFQSLLPLVERAPLLVIAAFRPRPQEPSWAYHESASMRHPQQYQALFLDPLDEAQSRALVAGLLHIEGLPENVRRKILEKAEGNPFYVEEIIRSLLDSGLVVRVEDTWQATREIGAIALPDTLAGVITARLDRLDETARHILQAAAVIGREFTSAVLAGMVETPAGLAGGLAELQRRELVRPKDGQTFTFKHVLTQEAAYNSILLSNRRELHRRAAEALIGRASDAAAEIARHLVIARLPARAAPYLVQAGDQAARAYAAEEAIGSYRQALGLREAVEDVELIRRAYEGLGGILSLAGRIPEAQASYQEMLALAESTGDIRMQISALNKLGGVIGLLLGQFDEAEALLDRAVELSRTHTERGGIAEAALIRCQICTARADFDHVVTMMDEVVGIGRETGNREFVAAGLEHVASSLVYLARFDEAQQKAQEALQAAREIGNREEEAWLLSLALPICHLRNGDFEAARRSLKEGLQIAVKIGSLLPQAIGAYLLGEMARWQGEYELALDYGQRSLQAALPLEPYMPFMVVPSLGSLGMIYLEISEQFREKISEFHLHALRLLENPAGTATGGTAWADLGLCALSLGDQSIAEASFEKGLNHPNMFMRLERPRHLAGAALLASARGQHAEACRLAEEARSFAEEYRMRHHYPLTALVRGKVLAASGQNGLAVQAFAQAEAESLELGMRSLVWQARAGAAQALAAAGRGEAAREKYTAARDIVEEIASLFTDEELRKAYLKNAMAKMKGICSRWNKT